MRDYNNLLGKRVEFNPFYGMNVKDVRLATTTYIGTIVKVYDTHRWFLVEYGEPKQRVGFKFCDIGDAVKVLRR